MGSGFLSSARALAKGPAGREVAVSAQFVSESELVVAFEDSWVQEQFGAVGTFPVELSVSQSGQRSNSVLLMVEVLSLPVVAPDAWDTVAGMWVEQVGAFDAMKAGI